MLISYFAMRMQAGFLCIIYILLHLTWRVSQFPGSSHRQTFVLILKPPVSSSFVENANLSFSLSLSSFVYLVYIDRHLCMTYDLSMICMYIYMTWCIHIFVTLKVMQTESEKESYRYDGSESQTKFPPFGPLGSDTGETAEGVIRRLRDSLEISGHDKNHPHAAAPQPDQDRVYGLAEFEFHVSPFP